MVVGRVRGRVRGRHARELIGKVAGVRGVRERRHERRGHLAPRHRVPVQRLEITGHLLDPHHTLVNLQLAIGCPHKVFLEQWNSMENYGPRFLILRGSTNSAVAGVSLKALDRYIGRWLKNYLQKIFLVDPKTLEEYLKQGAILTWKNGCLFSSSASPSPPPRRFRGSFTSNLKNTPIVVTHHGVMRNYGYITFPGYVFIV